MNENHKRFVNMLAILAVVLFEAASFGVVWYRVYVPQMHLPFFRRGNWAVIGLYILFVVLLTHAFDGYHLSYLKLRDIVLAHVPAILIGAVIGYVEISLAAVQYFSPWPLVLLCVGQGLFVTLWAYVTRRVYVRLYPPRELLLIYGEHDCEELVAKVTQRGDRYVFTGRVSMTEALASLDEHLRGRKAVLLADLPVHERNRILKYCRAQGIRVYVSPKISDIMLRGAEDIHLFDTPLFLIRNNGISEDKLFVKRLVDIVGSLLICVVLSPLLLLIAAAVKLCDGGPVFYTQERLTRGGRLFRMIKFRSMSVHAEKDGARLSEKGDRRVTSVGRVLRRFHLDELPQLFNVLAGDMSLVGPRPEREEISREYEQDMPEFRFRLAVKAGLTGYAQVYGQYNTSPYDKLKLDLMYIENYSLIMDVKILLLTCKVLFQKENTEGIEPGRRTASRETVREEAE